MASNMVELKKELDRTDQRTQAAARSVTGWMQREMWTAFFVGLLIGIVCCGVVTWAIVLLSSNIQETVKAQSSTTAAVATLETRVRNLTDTQTFFLERGFEKLGYQTDENRDEIMEMLKYVQGWVVLAIFVFGFFGCVNFVALVSK